MYTSGFVLSEGQCLTRAAEDDYNQKSETQGTQGIFPVCILARKKKNHENVFRKLNTRDYKMDHKTDCMDIVLNELVLTGLHSFITSSISLKLLHILT